MSDNSTTGFKNSQSLGDTFISHSKEDALSSGRVSRRNSMHGADHLPSAFEPNPFSAPAPASGTSQRMPQSTLDDRSALPDYTSRGSGSAFSNNAIDDVQAQLLGVALSLKMVKLADQASREVGGLEEVYLGVLAKTRKRFDEFSAASNSLLDSLESNVRVESSGPGLPLEPPIRNENDNRNGSAEDASHRPLGEQPAYMHDLQALNGTSVFNGNARTLGHADEESDGSGLLTPVSSDDGFHAGLEASSPASLGAQTFTFPAGPYKKSHRCASNDGESETERPSTPVKEVPYAELIHSDLKSRIEGLRDEDDRLSFLSDIFFSKDGKRTAGASLCCSIQGMESEVNKLAREIEATAELSKYVSLSSLVTNGTDVSGHENCPDHRSHDASGVRRKCEAA
ncbi:hypothetical protein P7C73_g3964, partial [Tremellales sp. Uapishka_1]